MVVLLQGPTGGDDDDAKNEIHETHYTRFDRIVLSLGSSTGNNKTKQLPKPADKSIGPLFASVHYMRGRVVCVLSSREPSAGRQSYGKKTKRRHRSFHSPFEVRISVVAVNTRNARIPVTAECSVRSSAV